MTKSAPDLPPLEVQPCGRYEWERIVRRISMPKPLKLLAFVLATYADADGSRVRPGSSALADVTDSGERSVRRLMTILREDLGLIELVSRGGGRGGTGRTAEYRLSVPTDLLDRVSLLSPTDRTEVSPAIQVADQSDDSLATQMAGQTGQSPVDNSETSATIVADENDFHRPNNGVAERLTGQMETLTGHSAWPTTTQVTNHLDQPPTELPAKLTTAREDSETSQKDLGEVGDDPVRCKHNLTIRVRLDGSPSCAFCRREAATKEAS